MSKPAIPLATEDLSKFARRLAQQLDAPAPSHLSLMNMLARAAGFRNFQHLRAAHTAATRLAAPPAATAATADMKLVERCLQHFDGEGRLMRWPSRRAVQDLALWALWSKLPDRTVMTETEVNAGLNDWHLFDDPAILRRSLVTLGLVTRNRDGSDYRRVGQAPPPEARALLAALRPARP